MLARHIAKICLPLSAIYLALFLPRFAFAQAPPEIVLKPVIGFSSINQAVSTMVSLVFFAGGLIAFFYIVRGAIGYLSAGDNEANTKAARQTIQNAVIGLILLGLVYVIFNFAVNLIPGLGQFFN